MEPIQAPIRRASDADLGRWLADLTKALAAPRHHDLTEAQFDECTRWVEDLVGMIRTELDRRTENRDTCEAGTRIRPAG